MTVCYYLNSRTTLKSFYEFLNVTSVLFIHLIIHKYLHTFGVLFKVGTHFKTKECLDNTFGYFDAL